jgi:hypothetical protein
MASCFKQYKMVMDNTAYQLERHPRRKKSLESALLAGWQALNADFMAFCAVGEDTTGRVVPPCPSPESLQILMSDMLAAREKEALEAAKRNASYRRKWLRFETDHYHSGNHGICLRHNVGLKRIETSHGAHIPESSAERVWCLVQEARRGKTATTTAMPLGNYTLTRVTENGDIVVGCHEITYKELARVAKTMGLK